MTAAELRALVERVREARADLTAKYKAAVFGDLPPAAHDAAIAACHEAERLLCDALLASRVVEVVGAVEAWAHTRRATTRWSTYDEWDAYRALAALADSLGGTDEG